MPRGVNAHVINAPWDEYHWDQCPLDETSPNRICQLFVMTQGISICCNSPIYSAATARTSEPQPEEGAEAEHEHVEVAAEEEVKPPE